MPNGSENCINMLQSASVTNLLGITGSVPLPTFSVSLPSLLSAPPSGVAQALLTGIPSSVFQALANPSSRADMASSFAAGNTPGWYQSLPTAVKSYVAGIQGAAQSINPSYADVIDNTASTTAALTVPTQDPRPASTGSDESDDSDDSDEAGEEGSVASTRTSDGAAAPTNGLEFTVGPLLALAGAIAVL